MRNLLNPKTAAKQFARITKRKYPKVHEQQFNLVSRAGKMWRTARNRFFTGQEIVRMR